MWGNGCTRGRAHAHAYAYVHVHVLVHVLVHALVHAHAHAHVHVRSITWLCVTWLRVSMRAAIQMHTCTRSVRAEHARPDEETMRVRMLLLLRMLMLMRMLMRVHML